MGTDTGSSWHLQCLVVLTLLGLICPQTWLGNEQRSLHPPWCCRPEQPCQGMDPAGAAREGDVPEGGSFASFISVLLRCCPRL